MAIFLRQSHNVKPSRWGSPTDVQYAIRKNMEKIYGCDPDSEVLIIPGFWGLPVWDYSGYNNHGTNHGATYKDGSLDFDGDDYVDTGLKINTNIDHSVIGWAKLVNKTVGHQIFFGRTSQRFYIGTYDDDTADACYFFGYGSGYKYSVNATAITNGQWFQWALVADSGTARYCVNGIQVDTVSYNGAGTQADSNLVGALNSPPQYFTNGAIDEVRIAKATYTADQTALFYDRPWDLYRRVARPIWSIPAVGAIAPTSTIYGPLLGPMGGCI